MGTAGRDLGKDRIGVDVGWDYWTRQDAEQGAEHEMQARLDWECSWIQGQIHMKWMPLGSPHLLAPVRLVVVRTKTFEVNLLAAEEMWHWQK